MTDSIVQCPICSSASPVRISDTLYSCSRCGISFNTAYAMKSYDDSYFLDEYRNQYGTTYIDDYQNIYSLSSGRLNTIFDFLPAGVSAADLSLLDVGSAAGFFLACARDKGIQQVTGIEISEFASRYCSEHFNIPVLHSSFSDALLTSQFSIITAWYFIEHTADPVSVIERIYQCLKPGGIFAFSVPSIFGPLFIFKRDIWVRTHPSDHYIDFSPRGIRKILTRSGFKKVHVKPAGIHPERILDRQFFLFGIFSSLYRFISRLTAFSDTIEVYAVK